MNPPGARQPSRASYSIAVCECSLAAAVAAAYWRTFSVPLLFDDETSITNNPSLRHFASAFRPPSGTTVSGRPVLNISLAINYALSGTHVWSYHAVNLAIHIAACLVLFGIIRRTLAPRIPRAATILGLFSALLWGLHPLATESVTYVVQRAESLMGLFYLLTLYCFIRGADGVAARSGVWFACSVSACLLGMGTKEVMVSAPLIVLLYDRTFFSGTFLEAWKRRRRLYTALAATWLLLAFLVLADHGRGGTAGFGSGIPWGAYALTQLPAVTHYLCLSFWPHPLVFDYGVGVISRYSQWALPGAVVASLAAATVWALVRSPALGFLGAFFFAVLAPSSSFVPIATETMAEHRMYLPLIPLVVLIVMGIKRWVGRFILPIGIALASVLACATWTRNVDYQTEERIWTAAVRALPTNERAHSNLGDVLDREGRKDDALAQRLEALRLRPESATVHNNLGTTLASIPGRLDDAVRQFEEALRLKPDYAEAEDNLGNALDAEGRTAEAIEHFKEALRIKPGLNSARNNLGNALAKLPDHLDEAVAQYEEVLRINPDSVATRNNLGSALARMPGRLDEAISQFEEALRLDPNYVAAHGNLGNALATKPGRLADAVVQYEEALQLRPDIAGLHINLAIILLETPGRSGDAEEHLRAALRLQPDNATARQLLYRISQGRR